MSVRDPADGRAKFEEMMHAGCVRFQEIRMANIEVFTAGCPLCEDAVRTVRETACPSCTITVYDLAAGCETMECRKKARAYNISRVPAVVVDGKLCSCCEGSKVSADLLRAAGVGRA